MLFNAITSKPKVEGITFFKEKWPTMAQYEVNKIKE